MKCGNTSRRHFIRNNNSGRASIQRQCVRNHVRMRLRIMVCQVHNSPRQGGSGASPRWFWACQPIPGNDRGHPGWPRTAGSPERPRDCKFALIRLGTQGYAERVRSQFLSLRQPLKNHTYPASNRARRSDRGGRRRRLVTFGESATGRFQSGRYFAYFPESCGVRSG